MAKTRFRNDSDAVREFSYLRATQRIMGAIEGDDELMRSIANSDDRKSILFGIIEKKFENADNMKRAISARMDTSFKAGKEGAAWKHLTINQILDDYGLDKLQKDEKVKEKVKTDIKIEEYKRVENRIKNKYAERKEAATKWGWERRVIENNEKADLRRLNERMPDETKVTPAMRVQMEMEKDPEFFRKKGLLK